MSDVFISYSRRDIAFARLIRETLEQSSVDTWIDWDRIPVGQRWREEIEAAIDNANVFIFIVSVESLGSSVCRDEIGRALHSHKRIIPVLIDPVTPEAVREVVPELAEINWIVFEKDRTFRLVGPADDTVTQGEPPAVSALPMPAFDVVLQKLNQAIHTDWDWVRYHTALQVDALRWNAHNKDSAYLFRDAALREAERWLNGPAREHPSPTDLQLAFVRESKSMQLHDAPHWYSRESDVSHYAPDFDLTCLNCWSLYTFTPSEHLPIPPNCPVCGFMGRGRFEREDLHADGTANQ